MPRRERAALTLALLAAAACAALGLSWAGALPGGWRLRGLVLPHAAREAGERARHLADRACAFAAEDVPPGAVVFLGSSTIERFPLAAQFPGRSCVNRGVAGARADELARHLDALLPRTRPAAIVLYAGGPDRLAAPLDVAGVLGAVERLARAVERAEPGVPVLLLGLLPNTGTSGAEAAARARIDAGLAELAARHGFQHLPLCAPPIAEPLGPLPEALSSDGLHLNERGYSVLADRLRAAPGPFAGLLAG
jgi:lysophospholipase L1-like esterase